MNVALNAFTVTLNEDHLKEIMERDSYRPAYPFLVVCEVDLKKQLLYCKFIVNHQEKIGKPIPFSVFSSEGGSVPRFELGEVEKSMKLVRIFFGK